MSDYWQWQDEAFTVPNPTQGNPAAWREQLAARVSEQPLADIAEDEAMLHHIAAHATALSTVSKRLVVIGTGGASLGAQTLCALSVDPSRVVFLENCDPTTVARAMQYPREETSWAIISKSGETVETLSAALALIGTHGDAIRSRVRVVTTTAQSTLGQLATAQGWEILPHPDRLGGRFSVFSIVGLLPAAYAGMDIAAIARSAQQKLRHVLAGDDTRLWRHATTIAGGLDAKPIQILMAYADRLRPATQWWKQLWAESLGKGKRGQTPVTAIGSIDQHSQLQLYLDGPGDKLATLWLPDTAGLGPVLPKLELPGLAYLGGHRMGDVMQATAEGTVQTLTKAGVPIRVLRGKLNPESIAEWMMARMLETLAVSVLMGVDPYDQPAVEEGKKLARAALGSK